MAKMMTQLDLFTRHVIGGNRKSVNIIIVTRDVV